jgi:hypothetical protein
LRGNGLGESHRDSTLEIRQERYARGEISKEEFDAEKRDLSDARELRGRRRRSGEIVTV